MRVQITRNNNAATGYAIVTTHEDGSESIQLIDKTYPGEPFTLVLPANASNRKYFNSKKVEAAGGEIELTYKESKTFGPRSESTPRKPLEDYLSPEDKELYLSLVEKAKKARDEATRRAPMTELEKAERRFELAKARVEALRAKEQ
jgi:hypothetical protein